ncbi:acetyltransferase [Vibrio cholerae]|nr:acetyltransferase [Vibrio cholerae]
MVTVVVFEFSVMRCQPLRRALVSLKQESSESCVQDS